MKQILFSLSFIALLVVTSCKTTDEAIPDEPGSATSSIKVPAGFNWQNSRNVNFTINLTDVRFPKAIYMIAIYNGDPSLGGSLLAKGSATTLTAFKGRVNSSNQTTEVYIIKTAPDNSKTVLKVPFGSTEVIASIGI